MLVDDFRRHAEWLHRMTVDFVEVVPDRSWDFSPDPPDKPGRAASPHRIGVGFARLR